MKLFRTFAPIALCFAAACASTSESHSIPHGEWTGEAATIDTVVDFAAVDANPAAYYDRTVFVEANAYAVCKKMQCWMQIEDDGHWKQVRWDSGCGGSYKFPEEAEGKRVVVQGELYPAELTDEQIAKLTEAGKEVPAEPYTFNVTAVMIVED